MQDENEFSGESSTPDTAEGADNLQAPSLDRNAPRPGSAAHRIQQMSTRQKQLEGMLEKSLAMNERLSNAFQSQLQAAAPTGPKGTFDDYSDEQLDASYAESLNKDSEGYNPQKAALLMRELRRRDRESVKKELTGQYESTRANMQQHENIYREAIADLGEDAIEFENPSSPLKLLAVKEWQILEQRLGKNRLEQNPEYQRIAIQSAFSKWKLQEAQKQNGLANSKTRAREAISSGMETEVDNATSIKAHFARGDAKGGLLAKPGIQQMVQSVIGHQRRPGG